MRRLALIPVLLLLVAAAFAEKKPEASANVKFLVVTAANGKPIRNASIVLHPLDKHGQVEKGGLQLKTDGEGRTAFNGIPYGKLRVQVIARGFQTYGQDHEINQPEQELVIKLNPPQEQYSIYK
jgi:uncharacterized GH25 family protein